MTALAWVAIVILYANGTPTAVSILGQAPSDAACEHMTLNVLEKDQHLFARDIQIVVKCVNLAEMPLAASVFGTKP